MRQFSTPTSTFSGRQREAALRAEMVEVFRQMYNRRYIVSADGNISVRLTPDTLLVTPSGVPKGTLRPEDMVVIDMTGKPVRPSPFKPTSEYRLHLEVMALRPDVEAVVHAHPIHCIAFSLAGVTLSQCLLTEVVITLGSIPTSAYATPTTAEGPEAVKELFRQYNALILNRHGTVTVGRNLQEAYNRLETIEHVAETTWKAKLLGPVDPLPEEDILRLTSIGAMFGAKPKVETPSEERCRLCNACHHSKMPKGPGAPDVLNYLNQEFCRT